MPSELGARVRQLRQAQGLSGREVAARTGVSASYLSRLENGHLSPTVATLAKIVGALNEPLSKVFEDGRVSPVMRKHQRPLFRNRGVDDYMVTSRASSRLEVLETVVEPGSGSGDTSYSHPGDEECIVVLEGDFRVWVDTTRYDLEPGDSITFPCGMGHRWHNPGDQPTRVIWIVTPAFWYSPQSLRDSHPDPARP